MELYSKSRGSLEVPQTSPEGPRTSPEVPRTSPEVSPFSGKPDTLSCLAKAFPESSSPLSGTFNQKRNLPPPDASDSPSPFPPARKKKIRNVHQDYFVIFEEFCTLKICRPGKTDFFSQGKTFWVDSACADCPGFLFLGAADARLPSFVQEPWSASLD